MPAPETEGHTEVDEATGATPAPPLMVGVLWVGAFSVVVWGMFVLFGTFRRRPVDDVAPDPEHDTDAT